MFTRFASDDPRDLKISKLEKELAQKSDEIKVLHDTVEQGKREIIVLQEEVGKLHQEIEQLKEIFANNARSRNMIIRSYSKTGMVSKFMPE